jgi:hypothetical protein
LVAMAEPTQVEEAVVVRLVAVLVDQVLAGQV